MRSGEDSPTGSSTGSAKTLLKTLLQKGRLAMSSLDLKPQALHQNESECLNIIVCIKTLYNLPVLAAFSPNLGLLNSPADENDHHHL